MAKRIGSGLPLLLLSLAAGIPRAANIPFFPIDTTGTEYKRFVVYIDHALAGNPDYGFSPYDAMIRYSLGGDAQYADFAIAQIDAQVASEEALIAADKLPEVTGDSYLYVGEQIAVSRSRLRLGFCPPYRLPENAVEGVRRSDHLQCVESR